MILNLRPVAFHSKQIDLRGDISGLLRAHPLAPWCHFTTLIMSILFTLAWIVQRRSSISSAPLMPTRRGSFSKQCAMTVQGHSLLQYHGATRFRFSNTMYRFLTSLRWREPLCRGEGVAMLQLQILLCPTPSTIQGTIAKELLSFS